MLDLVKNVQRYKADSFSLFLNTEHWAKFATRYKLTWQKLPFNVTKASEIAATRGIYVFTLELSPSKLPAHGYMLYMGEAGQGTNGNLRKRFQDYRGDLSRAKLKRPRVALMLKRWHKHLYFNYCELSNPSVDLKKLESAFLSAVAPPVNFKDFNATMSLVRRAAF